MVKANETNKLKPKTSSIRNPKDSQRIQEISLFYVDDEVAYFTVRWKTRELVLSILGDRLNVRNRSSQTYSIDLEILKVIVQPSHTFLLIPTGN